MNRHEVAEFWKWFEMNHKTLAQLGERGDTEQMQGMVDRRFRSAARLGWEIGPGSSTPWCFSVALNGSLENLPIAQSIVALAPEVEDWSFTAGLPPKQWIERRFLLRDKTNRPVEIDASKSVYSLLRYPDSDQYDIEVFIPTLPHELSEDLRESALDLLLRFELGEVLYLTVIDTALLVDALAPDVEWSSISVLTEHISHLAGEAP